jgi:hypothetical protein
VTDSRQHRVDTLRQAARRKSEAKTKAAETAIRTLVKRGEPITFQSVQREAGVSHAFLYGNADLRARIERLRAQARPKPPPPEGTGSDNTIIQALTSQITHLKKQHRNESGGVQVVLAGDHRGSLELRRELARLGGNLQPSTTS